MKITILTLLLITLNISSMAQNINYGKYGIDTTAALPHGLKTGSKAPDFTAVNGRGDSINLYKELKKGPVVLFFYRGYWCPVCTKHLKALEDSLSMITRQGASVIGISPQVEKYTAKTVDKNKLSFQVLSDSTNDIAKSYDVLFKLTKGYERMVKFGLFTSLKKTNGTQEQVNLPVPATFIIDTDGTIVFRQFDYNYKNRASVEEITKHLPVKK